MPKSPKWNERPCPLCKEPVSINASSCPHCQTEFTAEQKQAMKGEAKAGLIGCGVIALVAVLAVAMCSGDKSGEAPATEATPTSEAIAANAPPADPTKAMSDFYDSVMSTAGICDRPAKELSAVATRVGSGKASIYDAAIAARESDRGCEQSWQDFMAMKPPASFAGDAATKATEAIERCGTASMLKRQGAQTFLEILDGDARPSKMADFKEAADRSQMAQLGCVASLFATAGALKVDMTKLPQLKKD